MASAKSCATVDFGRDDRNRELETPTPEIRQLSFVSNVPSVAVYQKPPVERLVRRRPEKSPTPIMDCLRATATPKSISLQAKLLLSSSWTCEPTLFEINLS